MAFSNYAGKKAKSADEPKYEIIKHFGKLTDEEGKYNKELNLISWNDGDPKFDLRPWRESEEKGRQMLKGITLTAEEIEELYNLLQKIKEEPDEVQEA